MIHTNWEIAERLGQMADLLEQQQANPYRVGAYRRAADTIANLNRNIADIADQEGMEGLISLPNIGKGIAQAVYELVATGRWGQLERLRGTIDPAKLFQTIPSIGPKLAQRIYDQLHLDSLEALESAAHDGRLETVKGIGKLRIGAIRLALHEQLRRQRAYRPRQEINTPEIALLLAIDKEYRTKASSGQLPAIAPKRFNPQAHAWLHVLHSEREDWHFTALYSNTALAHKLGRIHDWVVIYFYDNDHREGQHTVVTETQGALIGKRVVRGREEECRQYYQ